MGALDPDDVCRAPVDENTLQDASPAEVPQQQGDQAQKTAGSDPQNRLVSSLVKLQPWDTMPDQGGSVLALIELPEGYATALKGEAETQHQTLGEYLGHLVLLMAENDWRR